MINRLTGLIYDRLVQAKTPYRIRKSEAYNETTRKVQDLCRNRGL